ncbi:restriction endonuclease subunit S [Actinoplanes sp. NPDC051411]|uniref:restriction endonuclease subunit S n=1 Tax=Actinoplanes sp. NPDC051411 TaxID=3155522 RepID=UPI00344AAEF9
MRLKDIVYMNRRTLQETTSPDYDFHYVDISSVDGLGNVSVPGTSTMFGAAPSRARRLAPTGATIISTVRTYLRAIGRVPPSQRPLVFSTGFAVLEARPEAADSKYLYYLCRSEPFVQHLVARSVGVSYPAVNPGDIGDFAIDLPAIEEQRRIANFLDGEVGRIDRLLTLRRQQFATAVERLAARAALSTGRMAAPSRTETNCQWRLPLRRAIRFIRTGRTPATLEERSATTSERSIPWYTPAAIDGMLHVGAAEKVVALPANEDVPLFPAGSIIVTGIGESLGKVGFLEHNATGNQQLTALKANQRADDRFLAWQLWAAQDEIRNWAQYSRIRIINNDALRAFPVHLPLLHVQIAARRALDSELTALNQLKTAVEQFTHRALERRQALITAAVTGQIDATTTRGVD